MKDFEIAYNQRNSANRVQKVYDVVEAERGVRVRLTMADRSALKISCANLTMTTINSEILKEKYVRDHDNPNNAKSISVE
jgi:hypothetical protein